MTSRPTLGFSLAAMLLALVWSAPATAAPAVDAHAEIVAALFAASATQAATERAADASLTAERAEIEVLRKQVRAGQADDARLVAEEEQFVGELSARDRLYAEQIEAFRGVVSHITETPEGLAALQRFNNGDEAGAVAILGQLNDARDQTLQLAANLEKAVRRRDQAELAVRAWHDGKVDATYPIGLYEQVVALDSGITWDWVELSRLYRAAGRLPDALRAAKRAAQSARGDRDRYLALAELGDTLAAQGDAPGARTAYDSALGLARGSAAAQRDLFVVLVKLGDLQQAGGQAAAARQSYEDALAIAQRLAAAGSATPDHDDVRLAQQRLRADPAAGPRVAVEADK